MQNHLRNLIAFTFVLVLFSCNSAENKNNAITSSADSTSNGYISTPPSENESKPDKRQFIRTADLKFRVKDVIQSSYEIESITARMHGFVTHTQLTSNVENIERNEMSSDSTLISTEYRVVNTIHIRVPNTLLDSTLKEISKQISFLDYRSIHAEDVQLQLLANQLSEKRNEHFQKRVIAAGNDSGKKQSNLSSEESLLETQEQKDIAHIDNLKLTDQINYSSIKLELYQNQTVQYEMISNNKTDAFEPSFFYKFGESIKIGWKSLVSFFLSLIKIWAYLLVAILLFLGLKSFWKHKK
jgi:hypothetical protein